MVNPLLSPQAFIFDSIVHAVILFSIFIIFKKSRDLYKISMQKGIYYFYKAMLLYLFNFVVRYVIILLDFLLSGAFMGSKGGIILNFANMYLGAAGGLYLAYSIIWRKFEEEKKRSHLACHFFFSIIPLALASIETYLMLVYHITQAYIFFGVMILVLLYAIGSNCKRCGILKEGAEMNPFLSLVGLSLGVYIALFIENLLFGYLYTVHFYVQGIVTVFIISFLYNFLKIT